MSAADRPSSGVGQDGVHIVIAPRFRPDRARMVAVAGLPDRVAGLTVRRVHQLRRWSHGAGWAEPAPRFTKTGAGHRSDGIRSKSLATGSYFVAKIAISIPRTTVDENRNPAGAGVPRTNGFT